MSMWTNIKRVSRYGLIGFVRNGFVSLAAVFVMTITLFFMANLMISNAAMQATLEELKQKVDVTVYFRTNATEEQVMAVKQQLEALPEVAEVRYVSREEALAAFRERHKNDQSILQSLDELGENPLGASLEIRAKETSQYESIAGFLEVREEGTPRAAIDKVNFFQNKAAIDRLSDIIASTQKNGIAKALVLAICSLLIAFNTIRLAIYTAREEIGVMNLVGAGRWYVRGPFLIAGALYGLISALVVLLFLYPILMFYPVLVGLDQTAELLFGSFDSFGYYVANFPVFFVVITLTGLALGILSSLLSIRRYLRM